MDGTNTNIETQLLDLMLRLGSRWILWLLILLSVVAMAIIVERIWFFVHEQRSRPLLKRMLATLQADGAAAALTLLTSTRSMEIAVARASLEHAEHGSSVAEEFVAAQLEYERARYERGLAYLGTLGNNAPFIGLFGTVIGIVRAFHDLAANTAQGSQAVMAGIAEALVATGVGLLVALPAVAAYNHFTRRVEGSEASARAIAHEISGYIKAEQLGEAA